MKTLVRRTDGIYKRLFERQALGLLPDGNQDRDEDEAAEEAELSA